MAQTPTPTTTTTTTRCARTLFQSTPRCCGMLVWSRSESQRRPSELHWSAAHELSRLTCRGGTRDRKVHLTAGICDSGVMQVLGGVDACELRGFEQRIEGGGDLGASS